MVFVVPGKRTSAPSKDPHVTAAEGAPGGPFAVVPERKEHSQRERAAAYISEREPCKIEPCFGECLIIYYSLPVFPYKPVILNEQ